MNSINMEGDFELNKMSTFRDGGSRMFQFSDGVTIYQDYRIKSETKGEYFLDNLESDERIILDGERLRQIVAASWKNSKLPIRNQNKG